MATENHTISTQAPAQASMDYALLREAGLQFIEQLSSQLWTDYNSHDPGITILEVLCYAITDLGYRTQYDIKDLLSSYTGNADTSKDLFPVEEIFPNAPLTIKDYRKLLIDDPRIHNVWFAKAKESEIDVYVDEANQTLTMDTNGNALEKLVFNGLYEVQIEFEEDEELGDLNSNLFRTVVMVDNETYCIEVAFPYWETVPAIWRTLDFTTETPVLDSFVVVDRTDFDQYYFDYFASLDYDPPTTPPSPNLLTPISIKLLDKLKDTLADDQGDNYDFYVDFLDWHEVGNELFDIDNPTANITIVSITIDSTSSWNGGENAYLVTASIELSNSDTILTQLIITFDTAIPSTLENDLTDDDNIPTFWSNTIETIINRRKNLYVAVREKLIETTDATDCNYNTTSSLILQFQERISAIQEIIYGSGGIQEKLMAHRNLCEDFVRFNITRIQEIAMFGDFIIAAHYNPNKVMAEVFFKIDQFLRPIIRPKSLQDLLEQGKTLDEIFEGPLLENGFITDESLDALKLRTTIFASDLISIIMGVEGIIAVKNFAISNYLENKRYYVETPNCIELFLPDTYKPKLSIDKSEINISASNISLSLDIPAIEDMVKAKKQALIGDTVDTNYDLGIPRGVDLETSVYQSVQYNFPEVYGIGEEGLPAIASDLRKGQAKQLKGYLLFFEHLLAAYLSQLTNVKALFSIDETIGNTYFSQVLSEIPDIAPLYNILYTSGLSNAIETEEVFVERRNRFLDHLAARFAENFNEYALLMYARNNNIDNEADLAAADLATARQLITDKARFLGDYPVLSSQRGQGLNYKKLTNGTPDVWDSSNVSGLEKRLARLLGFPSYYRRALFFVNFIVSNPGEYQFVIQDEFGNVRLTSTRVYLATETDEMYADLVEVITLGKDAANYISFDDNGIEFFYRVENETVTLAESNAYTTAPERDAALNLTIELLASQINEEGFFLLEHILLRPRYDIAIANNLLSLPLENEGNYNTAEKDPYSFRISVVFPAWPVRLQDPIFRAFIEKTVRLETPAHIHADIYWLNLETWLQFEKSFRLWLESYGEGNPPTVVSLQNDLIDILNGIRDLNGISA